MAAVSMAPFTPYLAAAGIAWLYYRRLRRYFGRQAWQPRRTALRVALLSLVSMLLLWSAFVLPHVAAGVALGAAAGVALGGFALRHTRVERVDGLPGYTPHPWIGAGLAVLLTGRLAWRWHDGAFSAGMHASAGQASPLTLGMAAMLVAYSLTQAIGLMRRMRALQRSPTP
ncbi:MAG TPA: hypothetical protein VGC74_03805 [Stenotrophomonas sp.]